MPTATTNTGADTSNGTTESNQSVLFYAVNSSAEWKKQLITKEDPNHLHKSLGMLILISYIYRLYYVVTSTESDMGFVSNPQYTVPTIILHFLLNASSFIFKIPSKRISSGYRIWPEYRLHSLVFLCRNLAFMLLFYMEQQYYNAEEYHRWNIIIILATMAAADWSSYSQGPNHTSGFARELDVPAIVKYFFSMAQLGATAMILHGQRRYTMHFIMVIIIQGNAFLMTVRRKNLASHALLTSIYGAALLGAGFVAWLEYSRAGMNTVRAVSIVGFMATILRTGPRVPILSIVQNNKYLLWISLYLFHETYIRPNLNEEMTLQRKLINASVTLSAILLGLYKHRKEQQQHQTKAKFVK
jgi:hypothetical protein